MSHESQNHLLKALGPWVDPLVATGGPWDPLVATGGRPILQALFESLREQLRVAERKTRSAEALSERPAGAGGRGGPAGGGVSHGMAN